MTIQNARELHSHLNANLARYIKKLLEIDKTTLIGMAADISVTQDVYYRLTHYDFDDFEIGRLLDTPNPLEAVAAEWGEYISTFDDDDFTEFLADLLDDDEFYGDVPDDCYFDKDTAGYAELENTDDYALGDLLVRFIEAAEDYLRSVSRNV